VYFPVGLALTEGSSYLAVANSDFDLQYNAGTLAMLNLERARALMPLPCSSDTDCSGATRCDTEPSEQNGNAPAFVCVSNEGPGAGKPCGLSAERDLADQLLYPGRCAAVRLTQPPSGDSLVQSAVEIGAFATDVVYRGRADNGRLFIPVRGDATLHWVNVTSQGELECEQDDNAGACSDAHRAGNDPAQENTRDLRLGPEPFALDASPDGKVVLVTNQTSGSVSVFENHPTGGPALVFEVPGLPARPVAVAALPPPALSVVGSLEYRPGFLVAFRNAPEIDLIRYYEDRENDTDNDPASDSGGNNARPYAAFTNATGINVNASGVDSRGIAVDDSLRRQRELDCAKSANVPADCLNKKPDECSVPFDVESLARCLGQAAETPLDVFVTNRAPATLVVGRTTPSVNNLPSTELPSFYDSIALTFGPSRVSVGQVIVGSDASGAPIYERRVFAVCFDSRRIFVYDPERRRIDTEIVTGRGPHAIAIDAANAHLYVAHFTDSYIGVVSLNRRFPRTYGKMIASLGEPSPPRASK
jgi:hypothetical protein